MGNWKKLIFGKGIKLMVEDREEFEPSYYKLEDGDTAACLATGFSRHNATKNNSLFNETVAARISEDSLFNQVALMSTGNEPCEEDGAASGQCEETLRPDPTVNFVSLTVLGLRLLFLKTVVFNVLMTFRLWISQ
ncbi:M1-specific T cell receptor alpha chain-like [Chelmon rostratus]|uniref:M1-specific T cell receptor alpha chain-like n=1 Tax=Chelmon rostratus TaxID=109905 RepID=UPI001BE7FF1D|nr:M1-specific T cell receptor alpha chain-like [Chelmon rostratus]